jgi:hypothetical protein
MLKDCTKPVKSALAYTSIVRPTMEYASSVWDPTNRKFTTPKKVSSFLPPSHVVDEIGVLINIFKWNIYDPIVY